MTDRAAASIRVGFEEGLATVTLDAPPLNILTESMMNEISEALERIEADSSCKSVLFRANGKAFSAGADVEEHKPEKVEGMITAFGRMFRILDRIELPIVMAVAGPALGGGFELVLMADVLLATDAATFGQPEIRLGFFAPVGVTRLPELVGPAKAMEITASGRTYTAAEMQAYGLVSKVVTGEQLDDEIERICKDFRRASPLVMRMNARVLKQLRGRRFEEALQEAEKVFLTELMVTEDVREGLAAFFEKRRPNWKNR